jgi:ribosomal-protein-alanine N-acetyltransferase
MIATDRLILRRPQVADLEDIFHIFCDNDAMTYWSSPAHQSMAETEAWLNPIIEDPVASAFDYFIEFQGRIIGKLGCWRIPEIGFALNKAYWGQGIAQEAMVAFVAHMKTVKVCDHLFADVDPRNQRSKKLLEKCGFRKVGHRPRSIETHIGWCDSDDYWLIL